MNGNTLNIVNYFKVIDHDFININKINDDIFIYNSNDILIQNTWELPIVIQWSNSSINFKFETKHGDILFGIAFVPALDEEQSSEDLQVEIIVDVSKVNSSTEIIEGSFMIPCEGVVVFLWDNTFDWISNKQLSYHIEVNEPSFSLPDKERSQRCKEELTEVVDELESLYNKQADLLDYIEYNSTSVSFQNEEFLALNHELDMKSTEFEQLELLVSKYSEIIETNRNLVSGLCIRCLNRYLLSQVFSFISPSTNLLLVNKYWNSIITNPTTTKPSIYLTNELKSSTMRKYTVQQLKNKYNKNQTNRPIDLTVDLLGSQSLDETIVSSVNSTPTNRVNVLNNNNYLSTNEKINEALNESTNQIEKNNNVTFDYTIESFISSIDNEYYKLEKLDNEKRKVRRALKQWNALFERENNRLPTNLERKELVGKLYEDYHKLSYNIRLRTEKIDSLLSQYDLTLEKFLQLKQNPKMIWKGLTKFKRSS